MLYTLRQDNLYYSRYPKDKEDKEDKKKRKVCLLITGGIFAYGIGMVMFLSVGYYIIHII